MKNKNITNFGSLLFITMISFMLFSCGGNTNESTPAAASGGNILVLSGLSGSLLLDNGSPAANADVQVESHPEYNTKTDGAGNLSITSMLPGTYTVYIESKSVANLSIKTANPSALTRDIDTSIKSAQFTDIVLKSTETTTLPDKKLTIPGSLSGTVVLINNPNNIDLTGIDVYIPGTSFMAKTDSSGNFSLSNVPEGSYKIIRFDKSGLTSSEVKTVTVSSNKDTALGEVYMSLSTGPSGKITGIANAQSITIESGAQSVLNTNTVTVNLIYDTRAVLMKMAHESSFTNTEWVPVSKSFTFTSANNSTAYAYYSSDGLKNVYVKYADLNGLESSPINKAFYIDTAAPVITEVKMVNGWAQTGSVNIFADITAADSGTGIKEIMVSNSSGNFNSGETWQTYSARMNWTLPAGAGSKTIYVKVRDYLGNESNMTSDSINLDTKTMVFAQNYDSKVILYAAQSPYLIQYSNPPITFNSDLEIEAGTTIYMDSMASFSVKGVFKSVGSSDRPIDFIGTINDCMMGGLPQINLYQGLPGVSEANRIQYTNFTKIGTISVNGGIVSNNTFDNSSCTSGSNGGFDKWYQDNLNISNNQFINTARIVSVMGGNGNTTIEYNTGTVDNVITQSSPANNTKINNNTLSCTNGTIFTINNGNLSMSGNSFSGSCNVVSGSGTFSLSGLIVNGCNRIISLSGTSDITLSNSKFLNCKIGADVAYGAVNTKLTIANSDITVSERLIYSQSFANPEITLNSNNLTCANSSGTCDLFFKDIMSDYDKVTLSGNNISCVGDTTKGCRGFVIFKNYSTDRSGTFDFAITGNYWSGKSLPTNPIASPGEIFYAPSSYMYADSFIRIFLLSPDCSGGTEGNGGSCTPGDMNVTLNFDAYTTVGSPISGAGYQ